MTSHLITKVHKKSWNIGYSFGSARQGNKDVRCVEKMTPVEEHVKLEITSMLNIWLDALRNSNYVDRKIVNRFDFHKIEDESDEPFGSLDLYIRFFCSKGGNIRGLAKFKPNRQDIDIFWSNRWDDRGRYRGHVGVSDFNYFVLLHEIGHSFGLLDTYRTSLYVSNEFFPTTKGNNPPSIMSGAVPNITWRLCDRDYDNPQLRQYGYKHHVHSKKLSPRKDDCPDKLTIEGVFPDDRDGLEWLYLKYHHPNKIRNIQDCYHPEYELELYRVGELKGCVPKNPIMFMLKNGHELFKSELVKRWEARCKNKAYFECSLRIIPQKHLQPENTGYKRYPIHYAAMLPLVKGRNFIEFYPDMINKRDTLGMTPLHYAVKNGNSDIVEVLIDRLVHNCVKPLHSAELFCKKKTKADINIKNNNGMTPLHLAAQLGHARSAEALLKHRDIDITIRDKWRLTPLKRAHIRKRVWKQRLAQLSAKEITNLRYNQQTIGQLHSVWRRDSAYYEKTGNYSPPKNYAEEMIDNIQEVIDMINNVQKLQTEWPCWGQYGCQYSIFNNLCRRCFGGDSSCGGCPKTN